MARFTCFHRPLRMSPRARRVLSWCRGKMAKTVFVVRRLSLELFRFSRVGVTSNKQIATVHAHAMHAMHLKRIFRRDHCSAFGHNFSFDVWGNIISFLQADDLIRLSLANHALYALVMEDHTWKGICRRDLKIPFDSNMETSFSWRRLHRAAFDGSHSYVRDKSAKHIDWMRIGAFTIISGEVLVSGTARMQAIEDKIFFETQKDQTLLSLCGVKTGPWIADLHLVHCPLCSSCEGTMQVFDARHWDLFLEEKYQSEDWKHEEVVSYIVGDHCPWAISGIFDTTKIHIKNSPDELFSFNSRDYAATYWEPRFRTSSYSAIAFTALKENKGLQVKYYVMRAGSEGRIVGLRVTHQLV
ncbi:hypothetical protein MPTK1_7g02940 [Marchantia polymorpha subsp. ruderalis]|uniref:F-box domain-containing protein n=2 Tax=Marchantia polymorpha TaxID=3197 RepID=A0AAF6BVK2_MARPO|nr:hypothetical protein MARPO_0251s0003 [Marchantia polymorpha]BBN16036.1 hypothetical protein Mp_7g02940 [Marchantia polymorpha subsp. ruderalis]|eukprot:PTQ26976.1 hypothetical protein MARPO_0251s0003 [Marchantia polymorpha]